MKEDHLPYLQSIQAQYESKGLKLSIKQAKEVYAMEEIKDLYPSDHLFSQWEEWDYEHFVFREILTVDQYIIYEKQLGKSIHRYEQSLTEQDQTFRQEIAYITDLLSYHKANIFPILSIFSTGLFLELLGMKTKIEYLKTEYASFLKQSKKEILVNHFRQNRTFKPLELKHKLLQLNVNYLFPDYNSFKLKMDQPTSAISAFICSELPEKLYESSNADKKSESIYKRLENWKKDLNQIRKKYFPETINGWHTAIGTQSTKEEMLSFHMSLLLIDKDGYRLND